MPSGEEKYFIWCSLLGAWARSLVPYRTHIMRTLQSVKILIKYLKLRSENFLHIIINPNCFMTYLPVGHIYIKEMAEIQKFKDTLLSYFTDVNHVSVT